MRKPKVHLRHANQSHMPVCNRQLTKTTKLSGSLDEVTCKTCLKKASGKTHAGFGAKEILFDVTMLELGNFKINAIKAVRSMSQFATKQVPLENFHKTIIGNGSNYSFGLRECKDFVELPMPQVVATGVPQDVAEEMFRMLEEAGAKAIYAPTGGAPLQNIQVSPSLLDELTNEVYQMFKDHVCGDAVPLPKAIRRRLTAILEKPAYQK